ncbi:MAG: LPS-assembly protein LptD [Desulfobacterales bacterium]
MMNTQNQKLLRISGFLLFLAAVIFAGTAPSSRAETLPLPNDSGEGAPWRITADRLVYDQDQDVYTATGQVIIEKGATTLSADSVRFNQSTMHAHASGNVRLDTRGDRLSGSRMRFDLNEQTGTVYDGLIFIEEKNFYIRGDTIQKTGTDSYAIHRGSLTSCDGEVPDWQVTGRDLAVDIGGYGSVRHAALWAKKLPVAYLPYFAFPVKRDRQSGFLAPEAGYSDRNGIEFIQPYYWAIHRSLDATLYYHHIQNRGEKLGGEFRYRLSPQSQGALMFDGMEDRKVDDEEASGAEWGYGDDRYLRPNSDRYWFRMKADQEIPYGMDAQLDLDIVSDQDYLREFDDGYTGYNDVNDYFASEFGRDLDDKDDPVRENRAHLQKIWPRYSFNADLLWYDNVIKRRLEDSDDTLQQLPAMTFNALKQPMLDTPVFFQADSEYTYFYRQDGISGHRMDIHPRFFLPLRAGPFFTFEPSAGIRQTAWSADDDPDMGTEAAGTDKDYQHRELYDLKATLSTDLYRIYNAQTPDAHPIKHTVIPELAYEYVPDTDQSEYPDFDSIDRIEAANQISFSLTHLLTAKYSDAGPEANSGQETAEARYNRFFRFFIEQAYDFNKEKKTDDEPFLPLYAEMDITPVRMLNLHAEAEWSHEADTLLSHLLSARLRNQRGDHLALEYRYLRDSRQSIDLAASIALTDRIRISGEYERNLDENTDIEKSIEALYQSQCWSIAVGYSDDETDQRISGMIRLHGLGGIGNRL